MKWQQLGCCSQCGSPYLTPNLTDYSSFIPPPVRRTCKCLNGLPRNLIEVVKSIPGIANFISEWKKGFKPKPPEDGK